MKTKTLTKNGNWTWLYDVGKEVAFKWHITWKILSVRYNALKDRTYIKLERK